MKGLMICSMARECDASKRECEHKTPHAENKYSCIEGNCGIMHLSGLSCIPYVKPVKQEKRWKGNVEIFRRGDGKWTIDICPFKTRKQAREMKRKIEGILKKGED